MPRTVSSLTGLRVILLIDPLSQERLDQGLVGDVALVRQLSQFIQHGFGQAQRDSLRGWF